MPLLGGGFSEEGSVQPLYISFKRQWSSATDQGTCTQLSPKVGNISCKRPRMPNSWCFHNTSPDPSALLLEGWPPLLPGQALRALHHFQKIAHLGPEHSPQLTAHTKQGRGFCHNANQQMKNSHLLQPQNLWMRLHYTGLVFWLKSSCHSHGIHVSAKKILNWFPKCI